MAEKFGPLLEKWRNLSDLTQTGLVEELRVGLENERYSKSDISKWEHGRIPAEDIVEQLEKILSIPEGLLLRAAHYSRAAEYRRSPTQEELEEVDTEKELSLQRQQVEHIKGLQELARSVIESVPEFPDCNDLENLDSVRFTLWRAYKKLTGDAYWTSLKIHLGEGANELERMTIQLEPDLVPPWKKGLDAEPYKEDVIKAWNLITSSSLSLVADSADTREWEYYGLNPTCPWCPVQG